MVGWIEYDPDHVSYDLCVDDPHLKSKIDGLVSEKAVGLLVPRYVEMGGETTRLMVVEMIPIGHKHFRSSLDYGLGLLGYRLR